MGLYTFSGYDSASHLAEETQNAEVNAPKGIVTACVLSGITGILYILGLLFAMGEDIDGVANGKS